MLKIEDLKHSLGRALRPLFKRKAVAVTVVLSMALGIGINVAIFSVVEEVVLKKLPYEAPERLVAIHETFETTNGRARGVASVANLLDWQAQNQAFVAMGAYMVGRTIAINGEEHVVIGVMPETFAFPLRGNVGVWTPLSFSEQQRESRGGGSVNVIARLRPDAPFAGAQAEMNVIARRLTEQYPVPMKGRGIELESYSVFMASRAQPALLALWAAVGLVLLIACGNVANLLLAQSANRSKEFATGCPGRRSMAHRAAAGIAPWNA